MFLRIGRALRRIPRGGGGNWALQNGLVSRPTTPLLVRKLATPAEPGRASEIEYSCYFSLTTIQILLLLVTVLALVAMALAVVVLDAASTLSSSLAPVSHGGRCGLGGNSEAIELAHKKLSDFHFSCLEDSANKDKPVHQCPGFADAFPKFPENQPYAHYLAVTERENHCSGFCHVSARTLFVSPGMANSSSVMMPEWAMDHLPRLRAGFSKTELSTKVEGSTCGKSVGDYLWTWATCVAIWSFVLGPLLVTIGVALLACGEL